MNARGVTGLDSEISALQMEIGGYHATLKEMNSVLRIAKALQSSAELTISSLENQQFGHFWKQLDDDKDPNTHSSNTSLTQLHAIGKILINTHKTYQRMAQSALTQASPQISQAGEEIEANQTLLSCVEQSLSSLINLREDTKRHIQRMKNLTGAPRRTPAELWLQIFEERISGDERHYMRSERRGAPPFTVLKLTWVSQRWRKLIVNQPSLWRFVPIPHVALLSSGRHDRIGYYIEHLRLYPPTVYMVHWNNDRPRGLVQPARVLQRITSFASLELYISSYNTHTEKLLRAVQPNTESLVLFSIPKQYLLVTHAVLTYSGLERVRNILCCNVRPRITGEVMPLNVKSLQLIQSHIDNDHLVTFLERTSVITVNIEIKSPFTIEGSATVTDITLPNLTTLTANLTVLVALFNEHVFIPNLHTLTVTQEPTMSSADTRTHWASFITTHERKDTISTLGISSSSPMDHSEALPVYQDFISQVSNLEHLVLEGTAVVLGLMAMVSENRVPPTLVKLTISKSKDVTKDHLDSLSKIVHASQRKLLSLQIKDCPSLSEKNEDRLILDHNAAQKPEEA
ncbi:hypothetical protein CPB86DRAFT_768284 [Serendipita vermifera]|nr:hypothetical protein CPB86DRAFT_768284 [Serendipita vermifera]